MPYARQFFAEFFRSLLESAYVKACRKAERPFRGDVHGVWLKIAEQASDQGIGT